MTTPDQITGLVGWWRASDITGKIDGDTISSWADNTVNARAATQATGSAQPTYHTNVINGKPCVRFDGVDDALYTTSFSTGPNFTVFAVVAVAAGAANATQGVVNQDNNGGTQRLFQLRFNNLTTAQFIGFTSGAGAVGTDNAATSATNWQVLCGSRDTGSVDAIVNGTAGSAASVASNNTASNALGIGVTTTVNPQFGQVDITEIAIYDHALTTADRAAFDSYVQNTYGITVSDYIPSGGSGTATSTLALTGATTGSKTAKGSATSALTLTGSTTGKKVASGTATTSLVFTGSASGSAGATSGTATTALTITGTTAGKKVASGTATTTLTFTGSAVGAQKANGTAQLGKRGTVTLNPNPTATVTLSASGTRKVGVAVINKPPQALVTITKGS